MATRTEKIEKYSDTEIKIITTIERIMPVTRLLEEKNSLLKQKEQTEQQVSKTNEEIAGIEEKIEKAKGFGIDISK